MKFAAKNVEIKIANKSVTLLGLKIINFIINTKNVKKKKKTNKTFTHKD